MLRRIALAMIIIAGNAVAFADDGGSLQLVAKGIRPGSPDAAPLGTALSAAETSPGAGVPFPELADLARMLRAPLPEPQAEKRGLITLPKGYPADRALALDRLNRYRLAAGLRPYTYDPGLEAMGQAHADYILANAGTGDGRGHFELKGRKGYSTGGDEAARTSGIAFGESDPLSALEAFMSGTFHRMQFLRPEETLIGLGATYRASVDGAMATGGTLFVTREADGTAAAPGPRFLLFPPDGFDDTPTAFAHGENPDPRPGIGADSPDTGFPITINLLGEDVKSFEGATVTLKDGKGATLPIWLSYPGKPAVASPDLGIYAGDKESILKAYRDNYDAVFILPKAPLMKGATYVVRAELRIGGKTEVLSWSFKTRAATLMTVRPAPSSQRESLESALKDCRFSHDDALDTLTGMERGSSLVLEGCDLRAYASPYLAYFLETPSASALPVLHLGTGNRYGPLSPDSRRSFGPGEERSLQSPLE